jgi:hypothetical protein
MARLSWGQQLHSNYTRLGRQMDGGDVMGRRLRKNPLLQTGRDSRREGGGDKVTSAMVTRQSHQHVHNSRTQKHPLLLHD